MCRVRRRTPLLALAAVTLAACGSGGAAAPPATRSTVDGVGDLPAELAVPETTATATTEPRRPTATSDSADHGVVAGRSAPRRRPRPCRPRSNTGPVGRIAEGNQVLIIGDSILAGTAERYSGLMCCGAGADGLGRRGRCRDRAADRLRPRGPRPPRPGGVGRRRDPARHELQRRSASPTRRSCARSSSSWSRSRWSCSPSRPTRNDRTRSTTSSACSPRSTTTSASSTGAGARRTTTSLLRGDGFHPSDEGQEVLVQMVARALGRAPSGDDADAEPDCLPTRFTDDSVELTRSASAIPVSLAWTGAPGAGTLGGGGRSAHRRVGRLHRHAPRQGRSRRPQRRRQDEPRPRPRRGGGAGGGTRRPQGRASATCRRTRASPACSTAAAPWPTSCPAAASTRSSTASRSCASPWRSGPTSATSPATPGPRSTSARPAATPPTARRGRWRPGSGSARGASTRRSACCRVANAGASSWPASSSPGATCCASTSRPITSTSTPRSG